MNDADRWLLAWATGYAAVGAASVLVPLYAISLGAGALAVGLLAATAAFAGVPGALLWGNLAQRTGRRRPFVLVALGATALVLFAMPALATPLAVVVANGVLWFVVAAAAPVLNLVVVEGVPEERWDGRIGLLNAYQGYGWVAGLVVGTVWTAVSPRYLGPVAAQRTLLTGLGALTALAVGLTLLWYPEPASTDRRRFERVYRRLDRGDWGAGRYLRTIPYGPSRVFWGIQSFRPGRLREKFGRPLQKYVTAAALFSLGFAVFWGPMPAHLRSAGFGDGAVFSLFLAGNVGSAVCYGPVGRLTSRFPHHRLQVAALGARVALFPAGAFVLALLPLGALFLAIGVTWAVIAVTATGLVTRLAERRVRGDALGLYAAVSGLGSGVGNALGGWLAGAFGPLVAFGVAAAVVLVAAVLVLDAIAGRQGATTA